LELAIQNLLGMGRGNITGRSGLWPKKVKRFISSFLQSPMQRRLLLVRFASTFSQGLQGEFKIAIYLDTDEQKKIVHVWVNCSKPDKQFFQFGSRTHFSYRSEVM